MTPGMYEQAETFTLASLYEEVTTLANGIKNGTIAVTPSVIARLEELEHAINGYEHAANQVL